MTLTFYILWLLCGLGAAVFATHVAAGAVSFLDGRAGPFGPAHQAGSQGPGLHSIGNGGITILNWIALPTGFALSTIWLSSGRSIDASWIGGMVAALAAWELVRPGRPALMTLAAGALAALWASLIQVQGLPQPAAMAVAAALLFSSAFLARRRPVFAPPLLREEGLLAVLGLAVVVAVAPVISQGWQSALAFNLTDKGATTVLFPAWMLSFIGASIALGGMWSLWRRG